MAWEDDIAKIYPEIMAKARWFFPTDLQSAQDLAHESIIKMLTHEHQYEPGTNLSAWAFIIIKNSFINIFRNNSRFRLVGEDLLFEKPALHLADEDIIGDDIINLIDNLPEPFLTSFNQYLQGYKYEEIAESIGVPLGTVKSRIHIARQLLMEKIKEDTRKLNKIHTYNNLKQFPMAPRIQEKKQNLAKFYATVFEISNNNWVSVKSKPLSDIMKSCGLDHNWGQAINQILKSSDFFSLEGERSGMRYRCYNATIPDFGHLADLTIDKRSELFSNRATTETKPFKPKVDKLSKVKPPTQVIKKRTHFNVDDICYYLYQNRIVECEVTGVFKSDDGYRHTLENKSINLLHEEVPNTSCFESVEQLISVLSKKVTKLNHA